MRQLRMGVIGMGMAFDRLHYPAYQKLGDKFRIAAVCDTEREKAENWRPTLGLAPGDVYSDYREMLGRSDLDAFDIMVPIEQNLEVTKEVAKAGKPIICEKPLAATREQAQIARELPQRYGIPVMIAENYRYNDEINIIRDLVRTGEIGTVHYFLQNRVVDFPNDMLHNTFPAKEWRQHPAFPGGVFSDTGVHDIAALQHIFGPIDKVQAFGKEEPADFSPFAVIQTNLLFKSGLTGHLTFFTSGKEMQRPLVGLRIFGANGMIFLEERDCGTVNVAYNDGHSRQIPYQPQMGFYHELLNFYKAAVGEESISVTPEIEYGDAMVCWAILDAAKTQEAVRVTDQRDYEPALF